MFNINEVLHNYAFYKAAMPLFAHVERTGCFYMIYLDNSATTKPCKEAIAASLFAMENEFGNPSSLHKAGFAAQKLCEKAREQLAAALSCDESEILFTSGATESNNLALIGTALAKNKRKRTIVTTAIEHPSVDDCLKSLESEGYIVKRLEPVDGEYTPAQFAEAVDDDTFLVSAMLVNNETGLILPISQIAKAVKKKKHDVVFHTDMVQGFLKLPQKYVTPDIDLISISGHKTYAPKGIGALYVKKGVRLVPIIHGGGQQGGIRSGTESVPLISAFGAAAEAANAALKENSKHYKALKSELCKRLIDIEGVTVNSGNSCAPHIVSISVYGIRSEIMLHFLESRDIFVSSGSACSKGAHSHVLDRFIQDKLAADETLRISFSPETQKSDLEALAEAIIEGINTLAKQR